MACEKKCRDDRVMSFPEGYHGIPMAGYEACFLNWPISFVATRSIYRPWGFVKQRAHRGVTTTTPEGEVVEDGAPQRSREL